MRQRPVPYLVLMQWNINGVIWWNFHDGLHWKLSKWQLLVQPVMKISSKWWHFRFSAMARCWAILLRNADLFRFGKIIYTIRKSDCITETVILNFYLNVLSEKSVNLVWPQCVLLLEHVVQLVGFVIMAMVVGGSYSIWDEKACSGEASWETIGTIG